MTAEIIQLRDYDWVPPRARPRVGSAEVAILPVVRVVREIAAMVEPERRKRRSLLGEP